MFNKVLTIICLSFALINVTKCEFKYVGPIKFINSAGELEPLQLTDEMFYLTYSTGYVTKFYSPSNGILFIGDSDSPQKGDFVAFVNKNDGFLINGTIFCKDRGDITNLIELLDFNQKSGCHIMLKNGFSVKKYELDLDVRNVWNILNSNNIVLERYDALRSGEDSFFSRPAVNAITSFKEAETTTMNIIESTVINRICNLAPENEHSYIIKEFTKMIMPILDMNLTNGYQPKINAETFNESINSILRNQTEMNLILMTANNLGPNNPMPIMLKTIDESENYDAYNLTLNDIHFQFFEHAYSIYEKTLPPPSAELEKQIYDKAFSVFYDISVHDKISAETKKKIDNSKRYYLNYLKKLFRPEKIEFYALYRGTRKIFQFLSDYVDISMDVEEFMNLFATNGFIDFSKVQNITKFADGSIESNTLLPIYEKCRRSIRILV